MIHENLVTAICKIAEYKLSQMTKNIPVNGKGTGPSVPMPGKSVAAPAVSTPKIKSPSSYGSIDLMAPSVSAGGISKTPGAAYTDSLSQA